MSVQARSVLAAVEAADTAQTLTELPQLLLPALLSAFAADSACWAELWLEAGPLPRRYASYPDPLLGEISGPAFERHVKEFPLARHTRPGGSGEPLRRSDLQSRREYHRGGMYREVLRPLEVEEILATSLSAGGVHVCLSLHRSGSDFRPSALDTLSRLRAVLTRRLARLAGPFPLASPLVAPTERHRPVLTERQRQVLALVASGLTDGAIARQLGCSTRTVDKHLEHVYRRLGVRSRVSATSAWLTYHQLLDAP